MQNSELISYSNYILLFISAIFLFLNIKNLLSNKRNIVDFIYIVFFIFYILPIFFEEFKGKPNYNLVYFPKFQIVTSDFYTNLIYVTMMIIFQVILYFNFKKKKYRNIISNVTFFKLNRFQNILIHFVIFLPIILFFGSSEQDKLLVYGTNSVKGIVDTDYFNLIVNATNISTLCVGLLVINKNYNLKLFLKYSLILLLNILLNGKRNIVVLILLIFIYILLNNKTIKLKSKLYISLLITSFLIFFNSFYLENFKNYNNDRSEEFDYALMRIDYGRDDVLKMAIYHEINDQYSPILEYRGQSMLFVITAFIPRDFWPDKPLTYTGYFTSSLINEPPAFQHFGMTTGVFDEFIVNFSLILGFFISVFLIIKVLSITIKLNNIFFNLFTILVLSLLLTNDIKSYLVIHIIWVITYIILNKNILKLNKIYRI